jgi:glycosyltransferase involved in cell wall biosynthesis
MHQAIQSVQDQDYENVEHLIVIDGKEREEKARKVLDQIEIKKKTHILCLPNATGKNRFNGHRIYAMASYITNGDYIAFLDQDNWLDTHHFSSLIDLIYEQKADWAYSLRKIMSEQGEYITNDDCESLGKWRAFTNNYHHVDTSCYLINRLIAIQYSPIWYRKFREEGVASPDIALCNKLIESGCKCNTTGFYTTNYRLGSNSLSVKREFFEQGNEIMKKRYPDGFPWRNNSETIDYGEKLKQEIPFREINLIAFPNWQDQDINMIRAHLAVFLGQVFTHPLRQKLTILLMYPEELAQLAQDIINDIFFDNFDWLNDEQIPEIYLQSDDLSPMTRQALLSLLNGYITFRGEDTQENYWKNKLKSVHLDYIM